MSKRNMEKKTFNEETVNSSITTMTKTLKKVTKRTSKRSLEGAVDRLSKKKNVGSSSSQNVMVNKVSNDDPTSNMHDEAFEIYLKQQLALISRSLNCLCRSVEYLENKVTDIQSRVITLHQELLYRARRHDE